MGSHKKKDKTTTAAAATSTTTGTTTAAANQTCPNPYCFFCTMNEPEPPLRRAGIANCFKQLPLRDDQEHVLVLSGLWNIAMTHPDDPEFPSLGVFQSMANLIRRGVADRHWLLRHQNVYIPYYAAHVIGSYTMNRAEFAAKAVDEGVIPPLLELARGKISWVEQRVAVRALGHLASYEQTFEAVAAHEEEVVKLAMEVASTCLEAVYVEFVGVKDLKKRVTYHSDLLTRGIGGVEMEDRKAEEWASQLQCWSLYLLNCFACKGRALGIICRRNFLPELGEMWGGLVNHSSPAGVGLIRILCYSEIGRKCVAEAEQVVEKLCNLSRSCDDWQYMGIDCLLLLLKDLGTRSRVIEIVAPFLVDLIELKSLGDRAHLGDTIARTFLSDYKNGKPKSKNKRVEKALEEIWELKVGRRKREKMLSEEKIRERMVLGGLLKKQGNQMFWSGEVEEAVAKYSEALELCPLTMREERTVLYSNRAQCHLALRDPDSAIRDATRALCLCNPANSHGKSLWRRSQAYDMKGLAKESLMDCIMFVNGCLKQNTTPAPTTTQKRVKIPYYAARMISKQMDATWLFSAAQSKIGARKECKGQESGESGNDVEQGNEEIMRVIMENKSFRLQGLSTIAEEPFIGKLGKAAGKKRREKIGSCRMCFNHEHDGRVMAI